jgi:hypothetical protein
MQANKTADPASDANSSVCAGLALTNDRDCIPPSCLQEEPRGGERQERASPVPGNPALLPAFLTEGPVHVDGVLRIVPVYRVQGDTAMIEAAAALMRRRHPGMAVRAYAWDEFDPTSGFLGCWDGLVGAVETLAADFAVNDRKFHHHLAAIEADQTAPAHTVALTLAVAAPDERSLRNFLVHARLLAD